MTYTTNNLGVARDWANARHDEAKSSNGNFSHTGEKLWSYNTPIATLRGGVALLTSESYSVTTEGKHKHAARKALNYGRGAIQLFTVPFLLLDGSTYGRSNAGRIAQGKSVEQQHQGNLGHYAALIEAEEVRLSRAKVYTSRDHIERIAKERDAYKVAFQL